MAQDDIKISNAETLFKIPVHSTKLWTLNPNIKMHPEFRGIGIADFLFIVYYCDFSSDFFYLHASGETDFQVRSIISKAVDNRVSKHRTEGSDPKIEGAIEYYKKIQGHGNYMVYKKLEQFLMSEMVAFPVQKKRTEDQDPESNSDFQDRKEKFLNGIDKREKSNMLFNIQKKLKDMKLLLKGRKQNPSNVEHFQNSKAAKELNVKGPVIDANIFNINED